MRTVAVLCCARKNHYAGLQGVEAYDIDRDARTFAGDSVVVGHPPCRLWSAFTRHQAKPEPGERELGLWVVDQVKAKLVGYSQIKKTWLFFCGISPRDVVFPMRLSAKGGDGRNWQLMTKRQRSETVPEFAEWLVNTARMAK